MYLRRGHHAVRMNSERVTKLPNLVTAWSGEWNTKAQRTHEPASNGTQRTIGAVTSKARRTYSVLSAHHKIGQLEANP